MELQGFHWPIVGLQAQGTRETDRKRFSLAFKTMRETHEKRVRNQCPREPPTGEVVCVTLVGWNRHNNPAMKASNQPGGSLRVYGEFLDESMNMEDCTICSKDAQPQKLRT